jgi:Protein of unknown function (DUF2786)
MSKAARQRRLKKERERQQRRMAHARADERGTPGPGPSRPRTQAPPPWTKPRSPGTQAPPSRGPTEPTLRELAALAICDALRILAEGSPDDFRECVALLGGQLGVAGWEAAVSRELVRCLRSSVTGAWRHGWQPAELARHVGREMSDAHAQMAADMIADEMRTYAPATVDDRWRAQLAVLGGEVWRGSDHAYVGRWGARRLGGLEEAVSTGLELLYVLQHLVVLPRLCPLPGTARPAAARRSAEQEPVADERMLSKIRALLAKAESTEFAEEAEALSARAQELMAKYSIDHALLAAEAGRKEEPTGRRLPVDSPYEAAKASLLSAVAKANRCRAVQYERLGMSAVIGFAADLDAVELLFTSLLVQANTAMLRAGAKRDRYGRSRTRAFRQSFLVAYAIRIGERLAGVAEDAERQAAAAAPGRSLLPVLAARDQAVDDAVDEMFGDSLTQGRATRVTDAEGWYSGRAAADLATLRSHREVNTRFG